MAVTKQPAEQRREPTEEMGVGWVRAAGGGEVIVYCGPLWLWEELAPWEGEGGWAGGAG